VASHRKAYNKEQCERPERKSRLEKALSDIVGAEVRLEIELLPEIPGANGTQGAPVPSAAQSRQRRFKNAERNLLVRQAIEMFDGEIVNVVEPIRADEAECKLDRRLFHPGPEYGGSMVQSRNRLVKSLTSSPSSPASAAKVPPGVPHPAVHRPRLWLWRMRSAPVRENVRYCQTCFNLSKESSAWLPDSRRDQTQLCIVEQP
jgi:hypothetical protein